MRGNEETDYTGSFQAHNCTGRRCAIGQSASRRYNFLIDPYGRRTPDPVLFGISFLECGESPHKLKR